MEEKRKIINVNLLDGFSCAVFWIVIAMIIIVPMKNKYELKRVDMITNAMTKCQTDSCVQSLEKMYLNDTSGININFSKVIKKEDK